MGFSDDVGLTFKFKADSSQAISEIGNLRGAVKSGVQGIAQDFAGGAGSVGTFAASLGPVGLALGAVTGAAVGVGGALFSVAKSAAEAGSKFNDLHLQTGLSVELLSGLELQLKQSGTSLDALGHATVLMQKNLGAAASGSKELQQAFARLGVKDVRSALADTDGTLKTVIKSLGEMTSAGERNAAGSKVMGRSFADLSVFVKDTKGNLDDVIKAARAAGQTMTDEAAAAADAFGDQLDALSHAAATAGRAFGMEFVPEITGGMLDVTGALEANAGSWRAWGAEVGNIIRGVREAYKSKFARDFEDGFSWSAGMLWEADAQLNPVHVAGRALSNAGAASRAADVNANPQDLANENARLRSKNAAATRPDLKPHGGGGGKGGAKKSKDDGLKDLQSDERDIDADFQRESQALERDYRRRLDTLAQFTEQEIALLDEWIKEKRAVYDAEEKEVNRSVKNAADRERKLREIQQKRTAAEDDYHTRRDATEDKLEEQRRQADEANKDKRLKLAEATARARIATVERAVDAEAKTESEGAAEIGAIQLDLHDKQAARLRERLANEEEGSAEYRRIQAELGASEIERGQIVEETATRIAAAKKREVEAERQRLDALRRLHSQAIAEGLEAERMEIEVGSASNTHPTRSTRIEDARARAANARSVEEELHKDRLAQMQSERKDMLAKAKDFDEFIQIETDYHLRREAEARRHAAEMQGINQKQKQDEDEESPFKAFKDLWGEFKSNAEDAGGTVKDSIGEMSESVVGSLRNMKGALEQGIKAHILYGESIGKAIKQAAAEELAGIAARAAIKGLEHAAYALGSLAFGNFGAAAKHAAASAAFFALAATTGIAARALANSASGGGGSAAGDAVASTGRQNGRDANNQDDRTIREARRGGSPDPNIPTVHVVIHDNVKTEPGIFRERVVEAVGEELHRGYGPLVSGVNTAVVRAYRDNHSVRDVLRSDMLGEPSSY